MAKERWLMAALLVGTALGGPLRAQGTGSISGRIVDSTTQQPVANAQVQVVGTQIGGLTRLDGRYFLQSVTAGTQRVRVTRIGFGAQEQQVTVSSGATATADFTLIAVAAALSEVVVTGYGSQRREAITGSVAQVNAEDANKGVITNANQLVQGRVTGVQMVTNNGEPGSGVQIRVRGGTSISASNDPLYVVDGVPLQNEQSVASAAKHGLRCGASAKPAQHDQSERHRVDHGAEGRVGHGDLWKPRRERRHSDSDQARLRTRRDGP
jgi:iron complex outermembrane receptor protein